MSHRFTVSLEENEYGETIITLPDTIIEELGFNIGDELDSVSYTHLTLPTKKIV